MAAWPWPSGLDSGTPSASSLMPRMPNAARAPKPREEICRSCAWFWRFCTTRPGTLPSASERLTPGLPSVACSASMRLTEKGNRQPLAW